MTEGTEVPLLGSGLHDRHLVRVGDTVRRPSGVWTESVQHLLRQLRQGGFDLVPEPLGVDATGREVLGYIEGRDPGWPFGSEILSQEGAKQLGELARRLRAALRAYQCPTTAKWQFAAGAPAPGETMQHGDLGPWNMLWSDDGQIAGVLDWDFAQPGDPWYDTGHLAWFTVPLMDDDRAHARGFPERPDRLVRLEAFASGAGVSPVRVLKAVVAAQAEYERRVIARRAAGGSWPTYYERGFHLSAAADRAWTVDQFGHLHEAARRRG